MRRYAAQVFQAFTPIDPPKRRTLWLQLNNDFIDTETKELRGAEYSIDKLTRMFLIIDKL